MAQNIRDVMTTNPKTVTPNTKVSQAAQIMAQEDIGDVIVIDDGGKPKGILTDRDITTRVVAAGKNPEECQVSEAYSTNVTSVSPNDPVDSAIKVMRDQSIRRLPVVENNSVVGVVSLGDLAEDRDPNSVLGKISAAPPQH